jgi:hypothetical protein
MQERGKLASKKPVGTEGDTKVFEGEAASEKQESWRIPCLILTPTPLK